MEWSIQQIARLAGTTSKDAYARSDQVRRRSTTTAAVSSP